MGSGIVFDKGMPHLIHTTTSQPVITTLQQGTTVVPFTYFFPGYITPSVNDNHFAVFEQDPRIFDRARLVSVNISMPSGAPSQYQPEVDTVFRLATSTDSLDILYESTDVAITHNANNNAALPWTFWQASSLSDTFDPLRLIVASSGDGTDGNRSHSRVVFTAMIDLSLREGAL